MGPDRPCFAGPMAGVTGVNYADEDSAIPALSTGTELGGEQASGYFELAAR